MWRIADPEINDAAAHLGRHEKSVGEPGRLVAPERCFESSQPGRRRRPAGHAPLMEPDVSEWAGPKGKHNMARTAVRHGRERGSVTLGARRVPVSRPRVQLGCCHDTRQGAFAPLGCSGVMTAASATAGWVRIAFSRSTEEIHSPPH